MQVYATVALDIQQREAWEWASKLADYCNENYPGITLEVLQMLTGSGNRITWVSKHDSFGEAEAFIEWYDTDEGFQKIIAETNETELVDWTSIDRSFWRIR